MPHRAVVGRRRASTDRPRAPHPSGVPRVATQRQPHRLLKLRFFLFFAPCPLVLRSARFECFPWDLLLRCVQDGTHGVRAEHPSCVSRALCLPSCVKGAACLLRVILASRVHPGSFVNQLDVVSQLTMPPAAPRLRADNQNLRLLLASHLFLVQLLDLARLLAF